MICRICGRNQNEISGWLARVNEKGVPGVWECRPSCDTSITKEQAILGAITGKVPPGERHG